MLLPYIEAENAGAGSKAGRILLATVAGDVHDIGKNIVGVVLGCNNFEIIDLGVMVPKEEIVAKARELKVDLIGCSGLITPSLDEMRQVAEHMAVEGLEIPLLVGGAATSKAHTALRIAPSCPHGVIHCLDASKSVEVASILCDPMRREAYLARMAEEYRDLAERVTQLASATLTLDEARRDRLRDGFDPEPVRPAKPGITLLKDMTVKELRPFINWSFFLKGWEMQGTVEKLLADPEKREEVLLLLADANALLDEWEASGEIGIKGAFGLFPAVSRQEEVLLYSDRRCFCIGGSAPCDSSAAPNREKGASPPFPGGLHPAGSGSWQVVGVGRKQDSGPGKHAGNEKGRTGLDRLVRRNCRPWRRSGRGGRQSGRGRLQGHSCPSAL